MKVDDVTAALNIKLSLFLSVSAISLAFTSKSALLSFFRKYNVDFQNFLRDMGLIKPLSDLSAYIIGFNLILRNPLLIFKLMQLMKEIETFQYGSTTDHKLEIFSVISNAHSTHSEGIFKNKKVLVFVHGGGWGSGRTWQYYLTANGIGQLLHVEKIAVLRYPLYPVSTISDQTNCVIDSLNYLKTNEHEIFHNDINNVDDNNRNENSNNNKIAYILCGHSSGANICSLAQIEESLSSKSNKQLADVFIGLCGVYDIQAHYGFETDRGVHELSPMSAAAMGKENFEKFSPTTILKNLDLLEDSTNSEKITSFFPYTILIHGLVDDIVPHTSTMDFALELKKKNVLFQEIYLKVFNFLNIL